MGIEYTVFRRELEEAIPDLPNFLSEVGNIGHNKVLVEGPMQILLQIHAAGFFNLQQKGNYHWEAVAESIEKHRPHLKGQILD